MLKVLWGEGQFLRPQHFQRQDAYHESRLRDLGQTLHPYAWGCRRIRFDPRDLSHGILRVLDLSAVFPDGEPYDAPAHDALPEPLSLKDLPAGTQSIVVYFAMPLMRDDGGNCDELQTVRYQRINSPTADLFTDSVESELVYLGKVTRLLSQDQPRDAYVTIPIARINRTTTGGFELDEDFIPPSAQIGASPILPRRLQSLLNALQAKTEALYGVHRQPSQHVIEFRSGDIASFWLLHTVNTAFAALSHFFHHQQLHPERLHQEMLRLAGSLLTFSNAFSLNDLPAYDHEKPEAAFSRLFDITHKLLDTVISTRYFQIALSEIKPSFHLGRLDSQRIDDTAMFYLGINADMPPQELVQTVPVRFKIGAPDDVDKCVLAALPGVKLTHVTQVPAAIPVRPGSYYFQLDARGPLYERMLKAQSIMVYVPGGIHELKMELIAITE